MYGEKINLARYLFYVKEEKMQEVNYKAKNC